MGTVPRMYDQFAQTVCVQLLVRSCSITKSRREKIALVCRRRLVRPVIVVVMEERKTESRSEMGASNRQKV